MSQSTLPVRYSPEPGITAFSYTDYEGVWEYIANNTMDEYEGRPTKFDNIYYCSECGIIFVMPPWFTDYYVGAGVSPMLILQKYIKCCKRPMVFIRISKETLKRIGIDARNTMAFGPPFNPKTVWHISEQWINASIVAGELL